MPVHALSHKGFLSHGPFGQIWKGQYMRGQELCQAGVEGNRSPRLGEELKCREDSVTGVLGVSCVVVTGQPSLISSDPQQCRDSISEKPPSSAESLVLQ